MSGVMKPIKKTGVESGGIVDGIRFGGRREFLSAMGLGMFGGMLGGGVGATELKELPGLWEPRFDRKVRVGIVGYGVCRFGAEFGFQNHPNVEVVAVSDLVPERREGLMRAVGCGKSYGSLEELVKDPGIEAVFVATDAPHHAQHCMEVMEHGKHVMTAVPAVWGSLEDAERLVETVKRTGQKYMMAETSCFHAGCHAMRTIYRAGGFGRVVYSEGEYFHHCPEPIPSWQGWRVGMPPLWYPTHSTAYYVGVTGKRFTSVSAVGFRSEIGMFQKGANSYGNPFGDEVAMFETSEGGVSRMLMSMSVHGYVEETGRVFGERGRMEGMHYHGSMADFPDVTRPALPPGVPAGGHGGSHGPLMHEFVSAILEDREPLVDVYEALAMTVPGIVAHESAMRGGERLKIPQYGEA